MTIKGKNIKKNILKSGKKIGLVVEKDGPADRVITRSTTVAATLVNDREKRFQQVANEAKSKFEELRAKIHAATAPRDGKS